MRCWGGTYGIQRQAPDGRFSECIGLEHHMCQLLVAGLQEEAVAGTQDALFKAVLYAYTAVHLTVLCGLCHLLR